MSMLPDVSIVLLTKNAGPQFGTTLTQIFSQETDRRLEIVIVDSGSTDGTLEIARRFPVRAFSIRPQDFNFGVTRNYGFSLSRGEYIITISQDAVPRDRHWLENLISPFKADPNVVAVQGTQVRPEDSPVFYWLRRRLFYFTADSKKWVQLYGHGLSFVNCAVRRSFWESHPIGFTPFSEDRLFQREIQRAGGEIAIAEDAICFHAHNYTCRSLVTRLLGEGAGFRYAGLEYSLGDCLTDIIRNKWMLREGFSALWRREISAPHEVLFLFFRPICMFWGNRRKVVIPAIRDIPDYESRADRPSA